MRRRTALFHALALSALLMPLPTATAFAADKTVALTYIVEHPAIDAARKGIIDALADAGFVDGKTITLDVASAQGSMPTQTQIAKTFAGKAPDLIVAISTPSAQACQAAAKGAIPIVFSAVTDPVAAKLVKSFSQPDGTLTGTSDKQPLNLTFELIHKLTPTATKVGVLYNAGEANSVAQVADMKAAAAKFGISIVEATAAQSAAVPDAARSLVGKADVILLPTDSTVVSAVESVVKVGVDAKIPVYASDTNSVERGAMAALGFNYYKLGRLTGEIAAKVLNGAKPADIPVGTLDSEDLYLNLVSAKKMGVTLSEATTQSAAKVIAQ
ncbi:MULTISPECIES: ABC transporter substrate-binding protein [Rhizobium]|uniref:ABC transport system substrate-binding protein n=1 Tax=Rhizobium miluonense TaxID=411945 RepID=A0ABU1SSZ5_9HYPH|nr:MULTISPECIES: ABC transporter substrate-binding protein [Rhizobium]MBB3424659.1 putative ABC transport system substrate-binding protein [Rhizobium sp. BK312]MDR6902094.1 putative ABC transport system substrate-binding protein [Rhizobium miluonense]